MDGGSKARKQRNLCIIVTIMTFSGFGFNYFYFAVKTNPSSLSDDDQFVYQDVVDIDPDVKYAFSVKSVNVQGSSDFSRERIKELIGRITSGRPRPEEVGQLLLDLPLF